MNDKEAPKMSQQTLFDKYKKYSSLVGVIISVISFLYLKITDSFGWYVFFEEEIQATVGYLGVSFIIGFSAILVVMLKRRKLDV